MKQKILHVIDHTGAGGAQVFMYQSIRELSKDFDFSVAVLGKEGLFSEKLRMLGIPVFNMAITRWRWNPFSVIPLRRLIIAGKFDLIHAQLYKSYILSGPAARHTGCKVLIHDQTGIYPESLNIFFKNRLFVQFYIAAFRYSLHLCDHVTALTQYTIDHYRNYYQMKELDTTVLPNPVDLKLFNTSEVMDRSMDSFSRLEPGTRKVIMVARLAPEKDWDTFLDVAQRIRHKTSFPSVFLITGTGPEESRLRKIVQSKKLDHVHFLGYREDIPALMAQSDVFLLTSKREPFGNVVIEAMAAGCPVVATKSEGPTSYIRHGSNGYLAETGDAAMLTDHIITLLTDKCIADGFRREAKKTVESNFSLTILARQLAAIYQKVLTP